jgi:hypothetical protein
LSHADFTAEQSTVFVWHLFLALDARIGVLRVGGNCIVGSDGD